MADQEIRNEFDAAVDAVKKTPADLESWDVIESLTDELNRPDEVAALYRAVLARDLPMELAVALGERAANLIEEWFGDDPTASQDVLLRVLEIDPDAEWAFQRLTVMFSSLERWDQMLALYDHSLENTNDDARRVQLLQEAAQVAKDVANQPDKAIGYLQKLVPLKPGDVQLESSLERLLERHERWSDLIALWEAQLENQGSEEREQSRLRIARCWLDNLHEPARALEAVRPLLAETKNDGPACELLERIVTDDRAARNVRSSALDLLRLHYESTERPREIVRVIEAAIQMASPDESKALREEAGARLAALEDDAAAMNHYAALLALDPSLTEIQDKMEQLARRSGNFARYADGVAAAADASTDVPRRVALLAEAARIRLDMLEDEEGAIRFYQAALAQEGLTVDEELRVARRLGELLGRADRHPERLVVLERLARLDPNVSSRRTVIGEAARLAESLGETDRALALWKSRVDTDEDDLFALDAMIALLENSERWEPLIEMLGHRVSKTRSEIQRRADLTRIAGIYDKSLNAPDRAIEAWLRVQQESGESAETVEALADLYTRTERWNELADVLERASGRETVRVTDRLVRLADAHRAHLDAPARALTGYRNALAIDPAHEGARAGMTALLEVEDCRAAAAESLATAYRETRDWPRFLELLEPRLADAQSPDERLRILREAAGIQEREVDDRAAAASSLIRALPLAPKDRVLEGHMVELAEATGQWEAAADAYESAAQALLDDPFEAARLRFARGEILESRLERPEDAYAAFSTVLEAEPANQRAARAVVRLGTRLGRWDEVMRALIAHVREVDRIDAASIAEIEAVAAEQVAWGAVSSALGTALDAASSDGAMSPRLAFALYHKVALWHREHRDDAEASREALRKALAFDGAPDRERAEALRDLAVLDRRAPSRALFETLRRLAELDGSDLDVLREIAEVAIAHVDDAKTRKDALATLLGRATAAWRGSAASSGSEPPERYVVWAVERLVEHELAARRPAAAVDLLIDSARLPFGDDTSRAMRLRAAAIAASDLRDNGMAIQMYQAVLSQSPNDMEVIEKLAALYEAEGRAAEKLALRKHQLTLDAKPERRIELRLEVARLVGHIEAHGGRLEVLQANLDDRPGHGPSVDALYELLDGKGQHAHLADVLERQAVRLHDTGEDARSAELWGRVAAIAETKLGQIDRALQSYRRVVDVSAQPDALRALARLYMERNQPAQAVPWFENLLAGVPRKERQGIVLQLAEAHLGAQQRDRAIACLESNLSDKEPALEIRTKLAELYRASGTWEPLARLLTRSLPLLPDNETAIAYAREAANIYVDRLAAPDKAVPALEKALSVVPGDRSLRTQLAVGLRAAQRYDEAIALVNELIEEFGRRRSPERAALHVELARVRKAQGQEAAALEEMELASKMDVGNVRIQKELAEMSRLAGDLAKAERTYRSLLLVVRRQPPGDDVESVGPSEVLFELYKLVSAQGQDEQAAKELLETAIETAVQSDAEVRRLRRSLLTHGEPETLLRVLDMRIEANEDARSRAALLADKAEVLAEHLDRIDDALTALLEALRKDHLREDFHDRARAVAKRAGKSMVYVDTVKEITDNLRRKEDPPLVARQLIRAGEALEQDVGDMEGALEVYQRVEAMGERTAEAYFAIARVAGALGHTDEQARVLEAMLQLATSGEPSPAQIDALYRLAEIFIGNEKRRGQGIELLEKAFAAEPRYRQAGLSLSAAAAAEPANDRVMGLYERVARSGGDWEMLLDFLERRAQRPDSTPVQVREAVDVALAHDQAQRAEALLGRAVEAARRSDEGMAGAVWALMALAETRIATGDFASARELIHEAAEHAESDKLDRLVLDLAGRARASDKRLAAEMYEFLRERNPSARNVWEPLIELYRDLGDGDRLQALIAATLPSLVDPAERNALRMQHAHYFIDKLRRYDDAVQVLREVLFDDPDHAEAGTLLEEVLRQQGDDEGLIDFLSQRFEDAKGRRHPETVRHAAMRLGALLDQKSPTEALAVYRSALAVAPDSLELVGIVLDRLGSDADPAERAELMERLIRLESPEKAMALTLELVDVYQQMGDEQGVQRVLESGYRANPDDTDLRHRLESWYRQREMWIPLAGLTTDDARRLAERGNVAAAIGRYRDAASLQRDTLGDPAVAARILRQALELAPDNDDLVAELAACLTASGDIAGATTAIGEALDCQISHEGGASQPAIRGAARVALLLLRSDLGLQLGKEEPAMRDLEEAYEIDPDRIRPQLIEALDRQRGLAAQSGDFATEREVVMRLSKLLTAAGDGERTRALLMGWVERQPQDRDPLYSLLEMDKAAGNWSGVLDVCARLVTLETGEAQVRAALDLADAAEKAERPGEALQALEIAHHAQPDSGEIRDRLRRIYELSGAFEKLATVLLADGDHASDPELRYAAYRRAAEVLLVSLGSPDAALEPARKARELKPQEHDATVLHVDILTISGQTDGAIAILEEAIGQHKRRSPQLATLKQRMARIAAVLGDRDGQLSWLKEAFDVDRKNPEIAAELAQLATEVGDYDLAVKPLRAITLMDDPQPITRVMAFLWEAKIEHARGNTAKAELWARKALREDPNYADAQTFLDQITQ